MYLKEMGINTRNWVDSAKDRDYWRALVNAALKYVIKINNSNCNLLISARNMIFKSV